MELFELFEFDLVCSKKIDGNFTDIQIFWNACILI